MDAKKKKQLANCGIFTGLLFLFFLILAGFIFLSESNWEKGLRNNVDFVLQGYNEDYHAGNFIKVDSAISTSAAFFELQEKDAFKGYVCIVRMTTYYGPLPAVFIQEKDSSKVVFAGVYGLKSSIRNEFSDDKDDLVIDYWKAKCGKLFEDYKAALEDAE